MKPMIRRRAVQLLTATGAAAACLPSVLGQSNSAAPPAPAAPTPRPIPPAPAVIVPPDGFGVAKGSFLPTFESSPITPSGNGPAMPSSASGRTGARNASPNKATGMPSTCTSSTTPCLPLPRPEVRPSLQIRLQGCLQRLEGRSLGSRRPHRPLQKSRRQILPRHGQPSRQHGHV